MLVELLTALVTLVAGSQAARFDNSMILPVNNTVDIAIMSLQEDMNFFVIYHTTTRACSECDK